MNQRPYKQEIERQQSFLLPPSIEEYVGEDNPVRAIDSYVESLDLKSLGFKNTDDKSHRDNLRSTQRITQIISIWLFTSGTQQPSVRSRMSA